MKQFGLPKEERIKKEKDFLNIYSYGRQVFTNSGKFKAIYLFEKSSIKPGVKIAAAVYKKAGNAVWRNRVKRLIRESYRLNKKFIVDFAEEKKVLLKIVFSPDRLNQKKNKTLRYDDVMPEILELLLKIKSAI